VIAPVLSTGPGRIPETGLSGALGETGAGRGAITGAGIAPWVGAFPGISPPPGGDGPSAPVRVITRQQRMISIIRDDNREGIVVILR